MASGDLILKQWMSVVDSRTTIVCLDAAGQIRPLDESFDTLAGELDHPPAHIHCRSIVLPWMPGMVNDIRREANTELRRRPLKEREKGPRGVGAKIPPMPRDVGG